MEALNMMPARVRITAILKKAIYFGEYKSGDELSLTDIAEKLGVSRTPVREAFQELAREGLITLRMNRGAIVNNIDGKFIRDNMEMRLLLETEAAGLAAEHGMDTEELISRCSRMAEHPEDTGREDYIALNQDLHLAIWKAADNAKLRQFLMELWNGTSTRFGLEEEKEHHRLSTMEHLELLEAIKRHDKAGAREAMHRHIARSMENILRVTQTGSPEDR